MSAMMDNSCKVTPSFDENADNENVAPEKHINVSMKAESKDKILEKVSSRSSNNKAGGKPRRSGTFGRLLADVTNEQKWEHEEIDAKIAVEHQVNDALDMASKWIREDDDFKIAIDLEKKLKHEDKVEKAMEISAGENEALNLAIQERRRIQSEA